MIRKIGSPRWFLSASFLLFYSIAPAQTPLPTQNQQQSPQITPAPAPATPVSGQDSGEDFSYRIGPGDELDVRVFGKADLSRVVRVDNYGNIRLPFLKEMKGACYTEAQLAGLIAEAYKKYLQNPQVDVLVKEYRSQPVAVIGAVSQPGRFQLQRRVRVLELITFAGGPRTNAGGTVHIIHNGDHNHCAQNPAKVQTTENGENKVQTTENGENADQVSSAITSVKLRDLLAGAADSNPFVQPGDVISVPETDQIFVTGSVFKPGAFPLSPTLTLTQAVALAGGVNLEGSNGKVRLIRGEPGKGERKETTYSINDINRRKIQDVALAPNDIIEVPSSTMRAASRGILGTSINLLNALPYFILR